MRRAGYTLVEMMIVVGIISLLAMIAVPPYLVHLKRSKALEAVSVMAMIREEMRDYRVNHQTYFDMGGGNIQNALPTSVTGGVPTPTDAGLGLDVGVTQYFSGASYSVDGTSPASARFTSPGPVDFLIQVNGGDSVACGSTECAFNAATVNDYRLEMDNTDRIFVSYDGGTTWSAF